MGTIRISINLFFGLTLGSIPNLGSEGSSKVGEEHVVMNSGSLNGSVFRKLPPSRWVNGFGFLICAAAILFSVFYLERTLYLDPCPLCIIDRILIIGMGIIFLIAMLHNPARLGQRLYGLVNLVIVTGGMAVAGRHIWLQHLPADKVPECGAGLSYMLENFPLHETLKMVLQGSGECAEIQWKFLGLSIPEQTLLLFLFLAAVVLVQIIRPSNSKKAA